MRMQSSVQSRLDWSRGRSCSSRPHLCSISPENFGRNLRSLISLGEDADPPVAGYKNRHSVGIKDALDMQSSSCIQLVTRSVGLLRISRNSVDTNAY